MKCPRMIVKPRKTNWKWQRKELTNAAKMSRVSETKLRKGAGRKPNMNRSRVPRLGKASEDEGEAAVVEEVKAGEES